MKKYVISYRRSIKFASFLISSHMTKVMNETGNATIAIISCGIGMYRAIPSN